jgi:hypothetical protein
LADPDAGRDATAIAQEDSSRGATRPRDSGPSLGARIRRGGALSWLILALAVAAAGLMIATEFSTVASVQVSGGPPCEDVANATAAEDCVKSGGEQHSYALILLALLVLAMAFGAALGASRPAALALVAVGAIVLAIALLGDLPDARETGLVGQAYEARGEAGTGLVLEIVAGALAVVAGLLGLRRAASAS